jgi:RNA polymerase sigma-70 factor (ECF subfamily)
MHGQPKGIPTMSGPRRQDDALVRQTLEGDRSAFQEIYGRYRDKVFATVYRIIGNHEEAADVTQDVFVKVYRDLSSFKFHSKFSTWLYRIAVNFSINKVNERERHGRAHQKIARDEERRREPRDVPQERIQATIQRLNPKLRTVVVLRYIQSLAYEEIAEVLELSVGTVKSRLHLAHNALRDQLGDLRQP